jgi:WD40 repeat protein
MITLRTVSLWLAFLLLATRPVPAQLVYVLDAHTGPVSTAKFSPDGLLAVTGGDDHRAYLWSATNGEQQYRLQAHTGYIADAAFSPDGKFVATASADLTAGIWETASGNLLRMLYGHEAALTSIRFSSDGTLVATSSQDNTAKIWNASTAVLMATLTGHTGVVEVVVFSPDNSRVATGSMDGTAKVWDVASGETLATFTPAHTGFIDIVYNVEFSPDGTRLLTSQSSDSSSVWDIASRSFRYSVPGRVARFSPDGAVLAAAGNGRIAVYDAANGTELYGMSIKPDYPARSIVFTATNEPLAVIAGHASLGTWDAQVVDVQRNRIVKTLEGHTDYIFTAEFSPDRNHVLTAGRDATARLWLNAATTGVRDATIGTGEIFFCTYDAAARTIRAVIHTPPNAKRVFSLHNSLGAEMAYTTGNETTLPSVVEFDVSRLPAGLYFVRIADSDRNMARPVVITH